MQISNRDRALFQLALRVAEDSDCSDKHGTVIMRAGVILAVAANRFIGNPVSARWMKRTIHAEQRAILRLGIQCADATLYSARLHAYNHHSAPCAMCYSLLIAAGISTVIYHDGVQLIKKRV